MICARVLARSAYSQGARDQADLARRTSWPDAALLTIASALTGTSGIALPVGTAGVTCVGLSVKALFAWGSGPQALVKVERPQRSEDVRP